MMADAVRKSPACELPVNTARSNVMSANESTAELEAGASVAPSTDSTPAPVAVAPSPAPQPAPAQQPAEAVPAGRGARHWWRWGAGALLLLVALVVGLPRVLESLTTLSTDDAYVNGHVTFVAPRVAGQVARVLVDDNTRVRKGDLLVQLDREPFQVQLNMAQAAVDASQAELASVRAETQGIEAHVRSLRFALQRAIEDVDNQVASLRSKVATLNARKATMANAQNEYNRVLGLFQIGSAAKQEMDDRTEALLVAKARVDEALEGVHQIRVSLGLPREPESGDDLSQVPPDLDQTFSAVRQAQANLMQVAAELGVQHSMNESPNEMLAKFYKLDPTGDIDRIFAKMLESAPAVLQAEAKVGREKRNLDQAELNLRYCDIVSEIDGVVTRREVNPGNNVVVGQSLMAVRSLNEIWVDANFKETQLARLRIGQAVDLDVDMYGRRHLFKGRISGFTMGTGSTLALLPAENATGNFVKVVQRLPVRIEILDYDPDKAPLFVGLSVTPIVRLNQQPTGPDAGHVLQPHREAAAPGPAGRTLTAAPEGPQ
jgi:membrane fusion protein, multidrug efflux system